MKKERQIKRKIKLEETKQKILAKEGRIKRNRDRIQHTKQDVPKQRKKILRTSRGRMSEVIPTTGRERGKKIYEQNMGTGYHEKKAEWINNMETELQMLKESRNVNIHADALKSTF